MPAAVEANQLPTSVARAKPVQRTVSAASASSSHGSGRRNIAGVSGTAAMGSSSKARDMLRDYYGLNAVVSADVNKLDLGVLSASNDGVYAEACATDSPLFSEAAYMQHLMSTSTVAQLLRASTTLSGAISDLESERQALVYNHHHELIDASITISKMKVRAESLDSTLEQLKAGLARCTELEDGLRSMPRAATEVPASASPDWRVMLSTLLDLPMTFEVAERSEALQLWGTYEPILRKWREAGVQGIADVEQQCRDILNESHAGVNLADDAKQKRRRSSSIKVQGG